VTKCATVQAVFTGEPKSITDERGEWTSSIFRDRVDGPVQVSFRGLAGDKATQPHHGGPGAAICVHLADHYSFWNSQYDMNLQAGGVGENVTLEDIAEDQVCVGDIVRLGTAVVQVSAPRVPCANQGRRIGRPDWIKLTIRKNRTGFYLRVLEPGVLQAGDSWVVEERINEDGSIPAINRCMYLEFDPEYARRMMEMPGLEAWWKEQAPQKLKGQEHEDQAEHWTSTMKDGGN
jgi:MOSC domain-containing protein YiiM